MVRAEKKYVVAYEHRQARHYAASMNWKRDEWVFVGSAEKLLGLYGIILYEVRLPRFRPDPIASENMTKLIHAINVGVQSGRIIRHNVVNLP